MKDQYFGDEHDFKKYMMLRSFVKNSDLKLFIAWYYTIDEGKDSKTFNDGNMRSYLNAQDNKYKSADLELFLWLQKHNSKKSIKAIENEPEILGKNIKFYSCITPNIKNDKRVEDKWFKDLCEQSSDADVIFMDPDNGIKYNEEKSEKHVYLNEIVELWNKNKSLIIYQHAPYVDRDVFIYGTMMKLAQELKGEHYIATVYSKHVMYFFVLQLKHKKHFEDLEQNSNQWQDLLSVFKYKIDSGI